MNANTRPNWRNGRLVPTGKLKLIPESVQILHSAIIGIDAEAIDEIGAVWPLGSRMFIYEVTPSKWPPMLDGIYHLRLQSISYRRWAIRASSFEEAKALALKDVWRASEMEKEMILESITEPPKTEV